MATSSRYAVALHVLVALARGGEEGMTSERLAQSVNTNPVVVRRLLGMLVQARIVAGKGGRGGGYRLAREPKRIALDAVLRGVEPAGILPLHENPANKSCKVSCGIKEILGGVFARAESSLQERLRETSVADLLRRVESAR